MSSTILQLISGAVAKVRDGVMGTKVLNGKTDVFARPLQSVAAKARASISYFPLVISDSLPPETASMISRFAATRAAVYTRLALQFEEPIDSDKGESKAELVKRIRGTSLSDPIFREEREVLDSETSTASFLLREGGRLVASGSLDIASLMGRPLQEAVAGDGELSSEDDENEGEAQTSGMTEDDFRRIGEKFAREAQERRDEIAREAQKTNPGITPKQVEATLGVMTSKLDGEDAKNLNGERPLTLEITVTYRMGDNSRDVKILLGIKSVVHPVPSIDMIAGVGSALAGDSLVFQALRATSGEIRFLQDFLLNIESARGRAMGKEAGGEMLGTLRRQAAWNRKASSWVVRKAAFIKRGEVPPSATVAITVDEANKIRGIYGVDLTKASLAREFIRTHNLLGFIIVDEGVGLARVWEDGADDFERVPFSELREKGKDSSLRDVVSILGRA